MRPSSAPQTSALTLGETRLPAYNSRQCGFVDNPPTLAALHTSLEFLREQPSKLTRAHSFNLLVARDAVRVGLTLALVLMGARCKKGSPIDEP